MVEQLQIGDLPQILGTCQVFIFIGKEPDNIAGLAARPAERPEGRLDLLAEREDGLTPGEVATTEGRVQVLTVHAAKQLKDGKLTEGEQTIGRLKNVKVSPGEVLLGPPVVFDKGNVGKYDF